jgi:hypothetical protein
MNAQAEYIWFHVMLQLLAMASLAGLVGGAALIVRPAWISLAGKRANKWVSMRGVNTLLESWISLDRWFYQYHRIAGGMMLAGAFLIIAYFSVAFDRHGTAGLFFLGNHSLPPVIVEIVLDVFVAVCVGGAAFALMIGGLLLLRPGKLRDVEQRANQWLSMRQALKPLEIQRAGMDEYVIKNARPAGMLLLLGSLYIMAALLFSIR